MEFCLRREVPVCLQLQVHAIRYSQKKGVFSHAATEIDVYINPEERGPHSLEHIECTLFRTGQSTRLSTVYGRETGSTLVRYQEGSLGNALALTRLGEKRFCTSPVSFGQFR